jgi:hypothetical protein
MGKALLALAIVAVFASGAMALAFPALMGGPPGQATLTQTFTPNQITLTSPLAAPYYAAGVGNSPIGDNYVLSTHLQFDMSHPTELGLLARANVLLGQAYSASLNPANGYLALDKLAGGGGTALAGATHISGFDASKDYELVFSANGSTLTGSVYDGLTQVASLTGTDSDFTTGQIGVIDIYPNPGGGASLGGTFNNSTVSSIPEPGTVVMLTAGALALFGWANLRRGRR